MSGDGEGARPGRGTELWIAGAFLVTIGSAIAFAVSAMTGATGLAGFFVFLGAGAMAAGVGMWARWFMPSGVDVEQRHPMGSDEESRRDFARELQGGEDVLGRRRLLEVLFGTGLVAGVVAALFPFRDLGPHPGSALRHTSWRAGRRLVTDKGEPLRPSDLAVGTAVTVFPAGHVDAADAQAMLIRVGDGVRPRPGRDDWVVDGCVAYSKVCTHAGCPVGLYEATSHQLMCPCHQSLFDVLDGARPVFGPATRSLPQLPLQVDADGVLVARGDFSGPVGPGSWHT